MTTDPGTRALLPPPRAHAPNGPGGDRTADGDRTVDGADGDRTVDGADGDRNGDGSHVAEGGQIGDGAPRAFPGQILAPDPAAMRRVCGHFATGVTVVTAVADGADGGWIGATVNSFTSVSLDPPWVLFCLRHDSRLLTAIRAGGQFAVSILAARQSAVATDFAAKGLPSFDGLDCVTGASGAPVLRDSVGYLECELVQEYPGGDHRIVVGAVTALGVLGEPDAADRGDPLTFYRGRLARLGKECER